MNQVPELRLMARHKSHWPVNVVAALFVLITAAITNLTFPHNVSGSTGSARLQNSFHPVSLSTPLSSVKKIPKTPPIPLRIYDIHRGNTLWAIAVRFHVPVQELERVNHLTSPTIYAGQTLIIPRISVVRIEPRDTLNATVGPHPVSDMALRPENPPSSHRSHSGQSLALKEPPGTQGSCTSVNDELTPSPPCSRQDFRLLAHLVHAEAGTQPFIGQVAVAAVVLNRVKAPGFPKSIPQVIEEPGQFESVTNGSIWSPANSTAYLAAAAALRGWDPTHDALFFYNPSLPFNRWMTTLPITAAIASQVFCR